MLKVVLVVEAHESYYREEALQTFFHADMYKFATALWHIVHD